MLDGLLLLLIFQFAGELLVELTGLPVPGAVMGMILLLFALMSRQAFLQRIAPAANLLVSNLTLLILPVGVGIALQWHKYAEHGLALLIAVVGATILIQVFAVLLLQRILPSATVSGETVEQADEGAKHD